MTSPSGDSSFSGSPEAVGGRSGRLAALVVVCIVAFIGIAIAKPWGTPAEPPTTPRPPAEVATAAVASQSAATTEAPATEDPTGTAAFTMSAPPPATAAWSAIRWRRLAPDDPLGLVTSVLRWRGGYIALGWNATDLPGTPVWTSTDGVDWQPVPFDTATTFWPGTHVLNVVEVPGGLVALTEMAADCGDGSCPYASVPPVVPWTSPDGRDWTPHAPIDWLTTPTGDPPLVAAGPAGIVAASRGPKVRIATSTDGITWSALPAKTLPASFVLDDLRGTGEGYVATGTWLTGTDHRGAATLSSPDGRHWSRTPKLPPTSPGAGADAASEVVSLVAGRDGVVAVGRGATIPGAVLWWRSPDGRRWTAIPTFGHLGPVACTGDGCLLQPDWALEGDGRWIVAVRGGPDPRVWISSDGSSWRDVPLSGDVPDGQARRVTLLPGGILLRDGSSTWFGEAIVGP